MSETDLSELLEVYKNELPNPDIIDLEIRLWKTLWSECSSEIRPTTLASAIKECNETKYPNISILVLKIGCTCPVTSSELSVVFLLCEDCEPGCDPVCRWSDSVHSQ